MAAPSHERLPCLDQVDPYFRVTARANPDLADRIGRLIDPIWGAPALAAMHAAARHARHIQVGQSAGATIELPAHIVRENRLEILGFAHIDPPVETRREAYLKLTELAAAGTLQVDTLPLPLPELDKAWKLQQQGAPAKLVLTPQPE